MLTFLLVDDKGTLRVYSVSASKKEGDKEWESAPSRIGWDNGQRDYTVPMSEVKSRTVLMVRPRFVYSDRDGTWQPTAETVPTAAPRDAAEPPTAGAGLTLTPVLRLPA